MYFTKENGILKGDFKSLPNATYLAKEVKKTRTLKLNNLYWLWINCIVEEYANYGYIHTQQFIHNQFKKCFLPKERIKSDFSKKYIFKIGSTAQLTNKEFVKYLDNIKVIVEFGKLGEIDGLEEISGFVLPEPDFNF